MGRRKGTWTAPASVRELFPEGVSGNDINGCGEPAPRRPTPIFWHRLEKEAFGALQTHVVERFNSVPAFRDAYARGDRGPRKLDPVAAERREGTAEAFTAEVRRFALANEADLVGVARLDPAWIFAGYEHAAQYVVVFGIAMDHARLSQVPSTADHPDGQVEVALAYNRGARVAMRVADAKQLVRGVEKWYVDFDKCIPCFNETYGCGICIAVCPWSTPGRAPTLAERWSQRRRNR